MQQECMCGHACGAPSCAWWRPHTRPDGPHPIPPPASLAQFPAAPLPRLHLVLGAGKHSPSGGERARAAAAEGRGDAPARRLGSLRRGRRGPSGRCQDGLRGSGLQKTDWPCRSMGRQSGPTCGAQKLVRETRPDAIVTLGTLAEVGEARRVRARRYEYLGPVCCLQSCSDGAAFVQGAQRGWRPVADGAT